ncbi:putative MFS family arabinose efflux permease [Promicromonospora sp. AC04]|uniref:MFS transporter n=1 Tax=Promicromonospora sp. AC04 TaxID=2135723 RepID=UPI000D37C7AE|nr:MFS transporter [Promicromonospora sp. AC04]PUB28656.1 putative MFS family arabinose efflux permease [Promicromonospora sp. AC04]
MPKTATSPRSNPYATVLRTPGALKFSAAGALARLPMSMVGIGAVLMVQGLYDSYAMAGRVAAVLGLAQAFLAPQIARWVDRRGQRTVLLPTLAVSVVGLGGLITAAVLGAPEWVLWLFAAVAGGSQGSYGSMVRARWNHALDDPRHLHTAYSLESSIDELVYIVGPVLATTLATAVAAPSALVLAGVATLVGGLLFVVQRATEPPFVVPDAGARHRPVVLVPGMPVVVLVFVAMGVIFGSTEVSTVAFAEEQGSKGLSGVVLAVFALGSLLSGLTYGARHFTSPASRRFVTGMAALGLGVSLFLLAQSLWALAAVMFVAGFAIAPTIITGNGLVHDMVGKHQLTEALAWVATSIGIGTSIGASIAGARVDAAGADAGFLVAVVAGWFAALLTVAASRTLRRQSAAARAGGR